MCRWVWCVIASGFAVSAPSGAGRVCFSFRSPPIHRRIRAKTDVCCLLFSIHQFHCKELQLTLFSILVNLEIFFWDVSIISSSKMIKMIYWCPFKRSDNQAEKDFITLKTAEQHRNKKNKSSQSFCDPLSLSPEQWYSFSLLHRSWLRWRVTSSVPASSQWWPWGYVWGAVTGGAGWAGGARRRTDRCHRNARG